MRYSGYSQLKLFTESRNIFTYINVERMILALLEDDAEKMEHLSHLQKDLELKREMQKTLAVDLEAAAKEKEAIIEKLRNNQEILESDIISSRSAIQELEHMELQLEEESENIGSEILALQEKYEQILEEQRREAERRAREEAARKAAEEARKAKEEAERKAEEERRKLLEDESKMLFPCPEGLRITSPFGWRIHPVYKTEKFHKGIDISAYTGVDIIAVLSGTVITAQWNDSYGYYVVVYHGNGLSTLYAHSSKLIVKVGDYVERGQTIALVGSTGVSTGSHLHFEVRVNGDPVNPIDYLPEHFF